jgi:hypothetical protein
MTAHLIMHPPNLVSLNLQNGNTPLHKASHEGQLGAIKMLLASGAKLDAANEVCVCYFIYTSIGLQCAIVKHVVQKVICL